LKTHSLLLGIRALAEKTRIRFVSGRPRTRGRLLPGQMELPLWDERGYDRTEATRGSHKSQAQADDAFGFGCRARFGEGNG